MSRIERDSSTGKIIVKPPFGQHSATLIILHGLGDSAEGFADVGSNISARFPHIKVILPTAKTQPVTLNGGMSMPSWYDIVGLSERSAEMCEGIDESVALVRDILEEEHQAGLSYSRMALAGFSQGGALSLFTGLQMPSEKKLAGICVMSGYLAGASSFKLTEGLQDTAVLHCHGTADMVVRHEWGSKTKIHVESQGASKYTLKSYEGMPHTVSMEVITDVLEFIATILPADSSQRVAPKDPSAMSIKELKACIREFGLAEKSIGLSEKQEFVALVQEYYAANGF